MSHTYFVVSPEILLYFGSEIEPAEYGRAVAEVRADTKRDAIRAAIDRPEMREWVATARSDGKPPFAGLTAEPLHCRHGVCLCDEYGEGAFMYDPCDECLRLNVWVDSLRDWAMREGRLDFDSALVRWANAAEGVAA